MGKSQGRPSQFGGVQTGGAGRRGGGNDLPWKWISFGLMVVIGILLLLLGPCGTCRRQADRDTAKPEPAALSAVTEPETPAKDTVTTARKRPARKKAVTPAADKRPVDVREKAAEVPRKTGPEKPPAPAGEVKPDVGPAPPPEDEEYDFRTRIEIITDPSK